MYFGNEYHTHAHARRSLCGIMTDWTSEIVIFRKMMICHWLQSPLFLVIPSQKQILTKKPAQVKNWQCCLNRKPRKADIFHVVTFVSTCQPRRFVSFYTFWQVYVSYLYVAYDPLLSQNCEKRLSALSRPSVRPSVRHSVRIEQLHCHWTDYD
jgi:hypothetical protein